MTMPPQEGPGDQPPFSPPGGPSQYGAGPPPAYGTPYGAMPVEHPQGTTILVLGILSLVVCGILGPVAWIMGNNAMQEIDQNPMAYSNRGSVVAGRVCGIVASCLLAVAVVFIIIALIAAGASGS